LTVTSVIEVFFMVLLIMGSAFFSGSETALTAVNNTLGRIRMERLAKHDPRAATVLKILDQFNRMISTILMCNDICNIVVTTLMTTFTIHTFGDNAVSWATVFLTVVLMLFGEVTPKEISMAETDRNSLRSANTVWFLMKVLAPVVNLVSFLSHGLMRLVRVKPAPEAHISNDEFISIIREVRRDGVLDYDEMKIMYNVLGFGNTVARDIMTPRADMDCLPSDADYEATLDFLKNTHFSRIPVYDSEDPDRITGIVSVRDIAAASGDRTHFRLSDIRAGACYTYEYKKVPDLLDEMQSKRQKVCFVVDEFGATVGMVTLSDLVEEIVGDIINDEIIKVDDLTYRVQGSAKLDDVNDRLHTGFHSDSYDSIGGYFIEMSEDMIPKDGQTVDLKDGIRLEVKGVRQNRIMNVLVHLPAPAPEEPDEIPASIEREPQPPQPEPEPEKLPEKILPAESDEIMSSVRNDETPGASAGKPAKPSSPAPGSRAAK
jgi:putative hemolysin